jgi:pimeloyl-ACP methyl ester carboxylesterase
MVYGYIAGFILTSASPSFFCPTFGAGSDPVPSDADENPCSLFAMTDKDKLIEGEPSATGATTSNESARDSPISSTVVIKAIDGFPLVIERFGLGLDASSKSRPVLLCPGFGGNRFNFDLDENHSLARFLVEAGFDVWIAELRGYGRSKGNLSLNSGRRLRDWNMDDHIERDLPAILKAVSDLSGHSRLIWIGHSLGGMAVYCLLSRHAEYARFFAGIVTIGSPALFERGSALLVPIIPLLRILRRRGTVSVRFAARVMCSRVGNRFGFTYLWKYWANPENTHSTVVARTISHGLEDLSFGTLHQWLLSMRHGGLLSCDGFDYSLNLRNIDVPILLISGTADRIAPSHEILAVYERIESRDKRLRVFGRDGLEAKSGAAHEPRQDSIDYGHEDLLVGEANHFDIFPYVLAWLGEHSIDEGD